MLDCHKSYLNRLTIYISENQCQATVNKHATGCVNWCQSDGVTLWRHDLHVGVGGLEKYIPTMWIQRLISRNIYLSLLEANYTRITSLYIAEKRWEEYHPSKHDTSARCWTNFWTTL